MKWIILAMITFIAAYTYLNLHYRKPGPSYRPYQDARERESIAKAGYTRVTLTAARPSDGRTASGSASAAAQPGGLPEDLRKTLLEQPLLPADIGSVSASSTAESSSPYSVQFACTLADAQQQLGGVSLYVKGTDVFIVTHFERLTNGLLARQRQDLISLTLPAGTLEPGRYSLTLVGQTVSRKWTLQVH